MQTRKPWKPKELPSMAVEGCILVKAPFILQERDHGCTALVGEIIANWSNCEWLLVEVFAYFTNAKGWVAAELFQEVRKLRPRVALTVKAMKAVLGSKEAERINHIVLKPLLDLSLERDRIAHANWEMSANHPDSIIAVQGWGKDAQRFLYDKQTLAALTEEIRARWSPLLSLYWACVHASPMQGEGGYLVPGGIDPLKFDLQLAT